MGLVIGSFEQYSLNEVQGHSRGEATPAETALPVDTGDPSYCEVSAKRLTETGCHAPPRAW